MVRRRLIRAVIRAGMLLLVVLAAATTGTMASGGPAPDDTCAYPFNSC